MNREMLFYSFHPCHCYLGVLLNIANTSIRIASLVLNGNRSAPIIYTFAAAYEHINELLCNVMAFSAFEQSTVICMDLNPVLLVL